MHFFGAWTTVVGLVTFWVFNNLVGVHELWSTTISWVLAVTFAFFTNRIWVFNSPTKGINDFLRQMISFFGGRLFSYGVEMLIMLVFATLLKFNDILIKLIATIVVLIMNYIISKVYVFKEKKE